MLFGLKWIGLDLHLPFFRLLLLPLCLAFPPASDECLRFKFIGLIGFGSVSGDY
jgi:hypothetical protein